MTHMMIHSAREVVKHEQAHTHEPSISEYELDMAAIALLGGIALYRSHGHDLGYCEYRQLARAVIDAARYASDWSASNEAD